MASPEDAWPRANRWVLAPPSLPSFQWEELTSIDSVGKVVDQVAESLDWTENNLIGLRQESREPTKQRAAKGRLPNCRSESPQEELRDWHNMQLELMLAWCGDPEAGVQIPDGNPVGLKRMQLWTQSALNTDLFHFSRLVGYCSCFLYSFGTIGLVVEQQSWRRGHKKNGQNDHSIWMGGTRLVKTMLLPDFHP